MAKHTAKQLSAAALEAFYAEDMVGVEAAMTELGVRFPVTAARLRQQFEDIIFEQRCLDDVGSIEL